MNLCLTHFDQGMGKAGEEHTSNDHTVWVTKSHFPENAPGGLDEAEFDADKILVITRNPIDVFPSIFLLQNIGSHSMSCRENIKEAFPAEWDIYIRAHVKMFKQYHEMVLN
jgi:hypothetical protein